MQNDEKFRTVLPKMEQLAKINYKINEQYRQTME
jgi:hypothetical protein